MKKEIILFVSLVTLLISCNREIPVDPSNNTSSTLLKEYIVLDTTLSAPGDTVYKFTFTYDNLNRCTTLRGTDGVDNFIFQNFYNGNDTLITRRVISVNSANNSDEYLVYSPSGKMLSDSVIEYSPQLSNFFLNYQNTTSYGGHITIKSNSNEFEYNNFTCVRDMNGNITNAKDSLFLLNVNGDSLTLFTEANISYDNKINPFYKLVPNFIANVVSDCSTVLSFPPFESLPQKNNILTEVRLYSDPSMNLNNVCNYEYNSNNYPTIVRFYDIVNNTIYKGIYVY